jgi:putative ABC transport system ATP-binding protein
MFSLEGVRHHYNGVGVLDLPRFEGEQGEHWLVLGLSGSGKTTLLHIMGGLLRPTRGTAVVAGEDLTQLRGAALDQFRGRHIGIVFQQMHLLATLTVAENLLLAQYMAGLAQEPARVEEVLYSLDLADKADAYPATLSFGQQQRVTIARAVMNKPGVILADEPTSALDDVRCRQVLDLLVEQARAYRATLVIATHDQRVKDRIANQLVLSDTIPADAPE